MVLAVSLVPAVRIGRQTERGRELLVWRLGAPAAVGSNRILEQLGNLAGCARPAMAQLASEGI